MNNDNGGPAFPCHTEQVAVYPASNVITPVLHGGMTLRDWFAAMGPQPGTAETCNMMGWKVQDHAPRWDGVSPQQKQLPWFNDLWKALPLSEQMRISAEARYAFADAMMKARKEPNEP